MAFRGMIDSLCNCSVSEGNCIEEMTPNDPLISSLAKSEQKDFFKLKSYLSSYAEKASRQAGLCTFINHLTMVYRFIRSRDGNDAVRGLACGIEFGGGFILVNTSRLKKLLYRSKSCMNGCFQKLGYNVTRPSQEILQIFKQMAPNVSQNLLSIRQWCVRVASSELSMKFSNSLSTNCFFRCDEERVFQRSQAIAQNNEKAEDEYEFFVDVRSLLNRKP